MKQNKARYMRVLALLLSGALSLAALFSCGPAGIGSGTGESTTGGNETMAPVEPMDLAGMDLSPYVALGQYKNVPVTLREIEYTVALRKLLLEDGAYFEKMKAGETDREIVEGDIINVDYTGYLDGVQFDGGRATNQDVTVFDGNGYIDGFATGFIGATAGESSSFDVTFPENYGEKTLAGKRVTFEFKINYIYEFDALTDEMADDLSDGQFKTAEAFEAHQRGLLVQEDLWLKVIKNATVIEYPEQHVRYYYQQNRTYYEHYADYYGMKYSEFLTYFGLTDAALYESAELYVEEDLVYYAIRNAENIELSKEEYDAQIDIYINRYKNDYGYTDSEIRQHLSKIEDTMLYDKVQALLVEWADVTWEGAPEAAPEVTPGTEPADTGSSSETDGATA